MASYCHMSSLYENTTALFGTSPKCQGYYYARGIIYCNIPISIGRLLVNWLAAQAFSQVISISAS